MGTTAAINATKNISLVTAIIYGLHKTPPSLKEQKLMIVEQIVQKVFIKKAKINPNQ